MVSDVAWTIYKEQPLERNRETGLLEHFTYGCVGHIFAGFNRAARKDPVHPLGVHVPHHQNMTVAHQDDLSPQRLPLHDVAADLLQVHQENRDVRRGYTRDTRGMTDRSWLNPGQSFHRFGS